MNYAKRNEEQSSVTLIRDDWNNNIQSAFWRMLQRARGQADIWGAKIAKGGCGSKIGLEWEHR